LKFGEDAGGDGQRAHHPAVLVKTPQRAQVDRHRVQLEDLQPCALEQPLAPIAVSH
jgi:hypothetical protein